MAYIMCKNLMLGYGGAVVTKDLNFQVNQGDYLCIVGENGAGKSTLMKTMLGLLPPVGGSLMTGDGLQAHEIGYLPQQSAIQKDFPASVWEIVLSGNLSKLGRRVFYGKEEKKAAQENMKRLGVWDLRKLCYRNLSGGQQQRVLLARALCATKKVLLLDEPVTGLDPKVTTEMYELIKQLNDDGITIIMISHDIQAAKQYAGQILHVGKKQLFFGTKEEYLKSDAWKLLQYVGGELK